jgi:hypothetical protein
MNDDTATCQDDRSHAGARFFPANPCRLSGGGYRARHYHRSPDTLSLEEIERYFVHLATQRHLSGASCRLFLNGVRFLYLQVLDWPQFDAVIISKPCLTRTETMVDYLGRYSHRIALSDARILDVKDGQVDLAYKDYRDGRHKVMMLDNEEPLRRFLLHVLPKGFMRIRHFGFLANFIPIGILAGNAILKQMLKPSYITAL